jgi:hypothetical protein
VPAAAAVRGALDGCTRGEGPLSDDRSIVFTSEADIRLAD